MINLRLCSDYYRVNKILYKTQSKTWKNIKQDDILFFEYYPIDNPIDNYTDYTYIKVHVFSENLDEKLSFTERVSMLRKFLGYFELGLTLI